MGFGGPPQGQTFSSPLGRANGGAGSAVSKLVCVQPGPAAGKVRDPAEGKEDGEECKSEEFGCENGSRERRVGGGCKYGDKTKCCK